MEAATFDVAFVVGSLTGSGLYWLMMMMMKVGGAQALDKLGTTSRRQDYVVTII